MTPAPDLTRRQGTVLYDDSCGFCRRWVPFWRDTLSKRGFGIAPLQSPWVRERPGDDDVLRDLRLLLEDGGDIRGADVYRHVMRRIWWARPLSVLASLPVLRRIFDWGYRTFAENRHRVSRACRFPTGPGQG
jgi:predicted DCC family thiol-disulfide oxidoreductase YuxK